MSHSFWANFLKMTWTLTQLSRSPLIHLTFWHCLTDFTIWIYEGYLCWNCRCWVQTRIKAVMNAHAALKDTGLLVVVANLMWFGSLTYWSHELLISRLKKGGGGAELGLQPRICSRNRRKHTLVHVLVITHHIIWQAVFPSDGLRSLGHNFM